MRVVIRLQERLETPCLWQLMPAARHDEFLRLYSSHHRLLYRYVLTLLGRPSDADDVMQNASVILWKKFDYKFEQLHSILRTDLYKLSLVNLVSELVEPLGFL